MKSAYKVFGQAFGSLNNIANYFNTAFWGSVVSLKSDNSVENSASVFTLTITSPCTF